MLKVKFESIVNGIVEEIDGSENVGPVTISKTRLEARKI